MIHLPVSDVCVILLILLLLLGGAVTTVTFSLMMFVSRRAVPKLQATHYTVLATVEVLGKLSFTSFVSGNAAEHLGFPAAFVGLTLLSVAILPWFIRCPEDVTFIGCGGVMVDLVAEENDDDDDDDDDGDEAEEEEEGAEKVIGKGDEYEEEYKGVRKRKSNVKEKKKGEWVEEGKGEAVKC